MIVAIIVLVTEIAGVRVRGEEVDWIAGVLCVPLRGARTECGSDETAVISGTAGAGESSGHGAGGALLQVRDEAAAGVAGAGRERGLRSVGAERGVENRQ